MPEAIPPSALPKKHPRYAIVLVATTLVTLFLLAQQYLHGFSLLVPDSWRPERLAFHRMHHHSDHPHHLHAWGHGHSHLHGHALVEAHAHGHRHFPRGPHFIFPLPPPPPHHGPHGGHFPPPPRPPPLPHFWMDRHVEEGRFSRPPRWHDQMFPVRPPREHREGLEVQGFPRPIVEEENDSFDDLDIVAFPPRMPPTDLEEQCVIYVISSIEKTAQTVPDCTVYNFIVDSIQGLSLSKLMASQEHVFVDSVILDLWAGDPHVVEALLSHSGRPHRRYPPPRRHAFLKDCPLGEIRISLAPESTFRDYYAVWKQLERIGLMPFWSHREEPSQPPSDIEQPPTQTEIVGHAAEEVASKAGDEAELLVQGA